MPIVEQIGIGVGAAAAVATAVGVGVAGVQANAKNSHPAGAPVSKLPNHEIAAKENIAEKVVTPVLTTTATPWDSSSGSSGGTSLDSLTSDSLNAGSSVTSGSLAGSFGSQESGSSGSFTNVWMWFALAACLCLVLGGGAAAASKGKKKTKKKAKKAISSPGITKMKDAAKAGETKVHVENQAGFAVGDKIVIDAGAKTEEQNEIVGFGSLKLKNPLKFPHAPGAPVSVLPEAELFLDIPPLIPLATTSQVIPSYSMSMPMPQAYAPQYQTYAAPMAQASYSMMAAPMTQAYAAPMTAGYAPQMSYLQ